MKAYLDRLPRRGTTPRNIVDLNQRLIRGHVEKEYVKAQLEDGVLNHSWWGVLGGFKVLANEQNLKVQVDASKAVRIIRPRPGFLPDVTVRPAALPDRLTGWLGDLDVVDVDQLLTTNVNKRLLDLGAEAVIAAEIHQFPEEGILTYAAVSVPWSQHNDSRQMLTDFSIAANSEA